MSYNIMTKCQYTSPYQRLCAWIPPRNCVPTPPPKTPRLSQFPPIVGGLNNPGLRNQTRLTCSMMQHEKYNDINRQAAL